MESVDDFFEYSDIIDRMNVLPVYGIRILVGLDDSGDYTFCLNHVGTIEGVTLLGLLELAKARLLEA